MLEDELTPPTLSACMLTKLVAAAAWQSYPAFICAEVLHKSVCAEVFRKKETMPAWEANKRLMWSNAQVQQERTSANPTRHLHATRARLR
jgi:hypothetical protein